MQLSADEISASHTGKVAPFPVHTDFLRSTGEAGQVRDGETGKELRILPARYGVLRMIWSPDGKQIATGEGCNVTTIWDAKTGKQLLTLDGLLGKFHGCELGSLRGG
jgi:WD40 repeat protein